mgnify:CR=1 FL=1
MGGADRQGRAGRRTSRAAAAALAVGLLAAALSAFGAGAPPAAAEAGAAVGAAEVSDGDTLRVGGSESLRLASIDAPERDQTCTDAAGARYACGRAATRHLEALVAGRRVVCRWHDRDRYDRPLARCEAGGRDLAAAMVRAGWALAYARFSDAYVAEGWAAEAAGVGLWSGSFMEPEVWRRVRREERRAEALARAPADPECRIKGNISRNGRLYHLVEWSSWARTRIDEAKGERWFCSEAEARAAGWRPAFGD